MEDGSGEEEDEEVAAVGSVDTESNNCEISIVGAPPLMWSPGGRDDGGSGGDDDGGGVGGRGFFGTVKFLGASNVIP